MRPTSDDGVRRVLHAGFHRLRSVTNLAKDTGQKKATSSSNKHSICWKLFDSGLQESRESIQNEGSYPNNAHGFEYRSSHHTYSLSVALGLLI